MSECYRVPSEVVNHRPPAPNRDADSSSDETPPTQPEPPPPPNIPCAISTPSTQEFPHLDDFPTSHDESHDTVTVTHPDETRDPYASDSESDATPPPRRSTRERRRPARFEDFDMD